MQLYAITDRRKATRPLLSLVEEWSAGGVDFIQLREKDLSGAALQSLTREVAATIDHGRSKLLVNVASPESAAMAMEAGADGVHLAGKPLPGAASRRPESLLLRDARSSACPATASNDIDVACGNRRT